MWRLLVPCLNFPAFPADHGTVSVRNVRRTSGRIEFIPTRTRYQDFGVGSYAGPRTRLASSLSLFDEFAKRREIFQLLVHICRLAFFGNNNRHGHPASRGRRTGCAGRRNYRRSFGSGRNTWQALISASKLMRMSLYECLAQFSTPSSRVSFGLIS